MNTLDIARSNEGVWSVVAAAGEVDVATSPQLLAAVEEARQQGDRLLVDLAGVTFMDSTGLGVVVQAKRLFDAPDALRLVVSEANVRKVFEVTGLDTVLSLYDSREDAIAG